MSSFDSSADDELQSRLSQLIARLDSELKAVAPVLMRISNDREEAGRLVEELRRRGVPAGG